MPPAEYLSIERDIALAHRRLWLAQAAADSQGLATLAADLEQLLGELQRLQEDLLRGPGALRARARRRA